MAAHALHDSATDDAHTRAYVRAAATASLSNLERNALITDLQAPGHTLRRIDGGFIAQPVITTSGPTHVHAVTKRMALRLETMQLVQFDDPRSPARLTLTEGGITLARELLQAANEAAR